MQDTNEARSQRMKTILSDGNLLQQRLDATAARKRVQGAMIGVLVDGAVFMRAACGVGEGTSGDGGIVSDAGVGERAVSAGCLAKLLTASLLADAVSVHRIAWDDTVADLLACDDRDRDRLRGVEVRHLVDHTHGLDAGDLLRIPLCADGYIDVSRLCASLAPQPFIAPGKFYSYGHVGAWLGGALLEKLYGAPYAAVLRAQRGLSIDATTDGEVLCPAVGADLRLTLGQWIEFARACIDSWPQGASEASGGRALPGWHPTERAVMQGWKCYAEGWFGHSGALRDASVLLRIHPEARVALVIAANEANGAPAIATGVFGDVLPEFRMLRPPKLLKPDEAAQLALRDRVGRYAQANSVLDVTLDDSGALRLSVRRRNAERHAFSEPMPPEHVSSEPASPAKRLRPAHDDLFLSESGGDPEFMFVQFIADAPSTAPGYLWNGRQIWQREATVDI